MQQYIPLMRAMQLQPSGARHALTEVSLPRPIPGKGEVLIRVSYAGLNHADLFQCEGTYPLPEETRMIPGLEVSGEIVEASPDVKRWKPGDKVCALLSGGGYAEYCTASQNLLLPVLPGLGMREAATLPEAMATNWLCLFAKANLHAGETLLVHGGASGIGVIAIQLARLFGARVFATAGSVEKCRACEALGAIAIPYREVDFVDVVKREGGVDVVLDMVGGGYFERNLRCLRPRGRMVSIGFLEGAKAEINLAGLLMKNLSWHGVTLRARTKREKAAIFRLLRKSAWPLVKKGVLKPVPDQVFPLTEAEKAHDRMRESLHIGKIVLEV